MSVIRFGPLTEQDTTPSGPRSREFLSQRQNKLDPYREHLEFPERWRRYLWKCLKGDVDKICEVFGVSPRCARKWLAGEMGCKGSMVAIAAQRDPVLAPEILFAAE